jgi:hypothetical protein
MMSQRSTASSQGSSQPMRDHEIEVSMAKAIGSKSSSAANGGVKPASTIHKWLAAHPAKPDDANDSSDERELLAMQSKTYIRKSISGANSTYNRTTNSTVNNTTTAASVLLSSKSKAAQTIPPATTSSAKSALPPKTSVIAAAPTTTNSKKSAPAEKATVQPGKHQTRGKRSEEDDDAESEATTSRRSRKDAAEIATAAAAKTKKSSSTKQPETATDKPTKSNAKNNQMSHNLSPVEIDDNIVYDIVSELPTPVASATSIHTTPPTVNFEIFQDDSGEDGQQTTSSAASRKSKQTTSVKQLAVKASKNTNNRSNSSPVSVTAQPMSSKQAKQREDAAEAAAEAAAAVETVRKKRGPKKRTNVAVADENQVHAKQVAEVATSVADDIDDLRRSKRVKCDHTRHAPRYEWTEMTDFEGKPIMVHCMVGLTKKHDVFGDFLREELSKKRNKAGAAATGAKTNKKRKRPRSSASRSTSPVKRSTKTKPAKTATTTTTTTSKETKKVRNF